MSEQRIAVLDVDGTLVDTNYQHALAWYRAFRSLGETFPVWRIHRLIGMAGDQLVAALGGDVVEARIGDEVRERWVKEADPLMAEVSLLPGARELIVALKERGHRVVLASSGKPHHVDHALDLLDVRDIVDGWTTSEDVEETKPAPDLLHVALEKIGEPTDAPSVVVGDSVYDVEAAKNAGMPAIVVRSGGFGDDELRDAGAVAIYDTPADLTDALDDTGLA
jgi:HAD superfamily hydrolase (TIGR01549 family)